MTTTKAGPMLEIDRVAKRYGGTLAVAEVSFTIGKGEFIALMGPSGCGKTTTLRMIAGLDTPSEGEIRLWGRRINEDAPWERDAPLVWQNYALFPFLSVVKNVEFGLKQRRVPAAERRKKAMEWMERLGIAGFAERGVDQLSGGQRQRVALARALALEPEMLLLDEPLSALDPHLRVRMQSELVRLHRELGITFVCVTHSHSEAFAMADRVVIMSEGRVQQIGAPREIYRRASNRFVAEFVGGNNLFSGTASSAGNGALRVEGPFGAALAPRPSEPAIHDGAAVTLVVAADRIDIASARSGIGNEIDARVVTLEVVGSSATVFLETAGGVDLRVQRSLHEIENTPLNPGQAVIARWSQDEGYFLPA
ncbi:ABC transporter ATP-binding protein [Ancylobacter defluvii]|uniref:Spermidine/putrescine import ATP-binding protein PotA n=1 Tax=Ancylobacter defluvii TaxID=1282440 RepID=A0A9W6JXM5_9HYPH|nr:ABC transporter ATP-binding protein [Ancylobacter defluvii]MBS7588498.1 ABC transporter ATP-binding protein [Ancylobacter defluvii]GLK83779.1 spermidine/putrescine import ATP-binding protein PotA [Ancylobacter defluvii]